MFSSSNRILRNRKLLDTLTNKVKDVSYLHSCSANRILNGKRVIKLSIDHRHSVIGILKPIWSVRLISTNVEQINSTDTVIPEPKEAISNATAAGNASSQNVLSGNTNTSPVLNQTDVSTAQPDVLPEFPIPDPPVPPVNLPQSLDGLPVYYVEPPFEHLGLGGWSPVGLVQNSFEFLHITAGLPWWECIVAATLITRAVLFPIHVIAQRNAAKMANNLPQFQELQLKVNEAKQRGDPIEAARYSQDLLTFMKEKKINPIKNAAIPLIQAPVFVSFFMGLREMANLPVKSMHDGGLWWFTDLTVPDQYYILPIVTCATMLLTIEIGSEAGKTATSNAYLIRYVLRFMPLVVLPFAVNFPGAILVYWVTSNTVTLIIAGLTRVKPVRKILKIEERITHAPLPAEKEGFIKGVKKWWRDSRTQGALEERARTNRMTFTSAGRGPIPKTYKFDPTASSPTTNTAASIQAKKFS